MPIDDPTIVPNAPRQLYRYAIEPYTTQPRDIRSLTIIADDFEIYNGDMVRFTAETICVAMFNLNHVGFHLLGEYHMALPLQTDFPVEVGFIAGVVLVMQ